MGTTKKTVKKVLSIFLAILLTIIGVCVGYLVYVLASYSRIEDNLSLMPYGTADNDRVTLNQNYTVVTQNLGFGAYTPDFTFFMDGGVESWAKSKDSVIECITSGKDKVNSFNPDFIFYQEVDTDSTRSYHVNQQELLDSFYQNRSKVFANNYHSAFLMYPFSEPHGASNSGILTVSKYNITSSVRRSLPISTGLSKFLDLDRCYSVSRVNVSNGKELVLYNVHLSAYGSDDSIRTAQMTMLFSDMKSEYEKGNYCVCGGDFNHDFTGTSTQDLNGLAGTDFGWAQPFPSDLLPSELSRCTDYASGVKPTCRNCDIPYVEGNFTIIVDGFIVSQNVTCVSVDNIVTGFTYSDHNPVKLVFELK